MANIASLVAARRRATSLLLRHLTVRTPIATATSFLSSTADWQKCDGQRRREWGNTDGRGTSRAGGEGEGEETADRGWAARAAVAATAAGLALAFGAGTGDTKDAAKNCGIVGVVSSSEKGSAVDPVDFLFEVPAFELCVCLRVFVCVYVLFIFVFCAVYLSNGMREERDELCTVGGTGSQGRERDGGCDDKQAFLFWGCLPSASVF